MIDTDRSLSYESLFFTNLLLLGFNVENHEKEYRIPFHKDMFKSSNVRAMEIITHFMMGKMEGDKKRNQMLKACWPVAGKNERNEFRKIIGEWMKNLLNRNIQRTMLMTCYGENFVQLLHDLSHHILLHYLKQKYPDYVTQRAPLSALQSMDSIALLQSNSNADAADQLRCLTNSLMLHVRNQSQQLLDNTSKFVAQTQEWKQSADKVTSELNIITQKHGQLHEKLHTMKQLPQDDVENQRMMEQQIRQTLSMFKNLHEKNQSIQDVQNDMCESSVRKPMDHSSMQTRNLPSILSRYNEGMKQMIIQTNNQPSQNSLLGNPENVYKFSTEQRQLYDSYLQNLQNFSTELKEVANNQEKRIEALHSEVQKNQNSSSQLSVPRNSFSLMQPTPPKQPFNVMDSPMNSTALFPVTPKGEFRKPQQPASAYKSPIVTTSTPQRESIVTPSSKWTFPR